MLWWLELEVEEVAASQSPGSNVGACDDESLTAARQTKLRLQSIPPSGTHLSLLRVNFDV